MHSFLNAAVEGKRSMIKDGGRDRRSEEQVQEQLNKNLKAAEKRSGEQGEIRKAIEDLADQVEDVRSGTRLKEAMDTLKTTIGDEKVAMRKQVSEMEARLDDAKTKLTELNDATTRLATHSPSQCQALTSKAMRVCWEV